MTEDLKRCPFCGTLPTTEVRVTKMSGVEDHVDFTIHCTNCGVYKTVTLKIVSYANFMDVDKVQAKVIAAWNQRAEEDND